MQFVSGLTLLLFSLCGIPASNANAMTDEGMRYLLDSMVAGRVPGLIAATGNQAAVELTAKRITSVATSAEGPGAWGYEWRILGEYYELLGDAAHERRDQAQALQLYHAAMALYGAGYRPDNFFVEERKSYSRFRDLRLKMNPLLSTPFESINVPFEGKSVIVHLFRPPGVERPPLVLYTGGVDGSKEIVDYAAEGLGERGYAVASFDLLGTGESMAWTASPDAHRLHVAVLDYFEKAREFDFSRVGAIGGSYGGYYVVQLVADEPRIKAAINHCGLVHSAFEGEPDRLVMGLRHQPQATLRSTMRRMGFDPDNLEPASLAAELSTSPPSLLARNVVGPNAKPIQTPLLTVNGTRDPVVSAADIKLVEQAAVNGETWLLGHGGHCAPTYMPVAQPHMIEWLDEHLRAAP